MASHLAKSSIAIAVGLGAYFALFGQSYASAVSMKVSGSAPECPWRRVLAMPCDALRFVEIREAIAKQMSVIDSDPSLDIQLVKTAGRPFWIRKGGNDMGGQTLLAYLIGEQEWIGESDPGATVRKGDWVIDVGAHVGVFTDRSLRRGAEKVFMVEPDPINVECIKRNFSREIASGRVILLAEGAWSKKGSMDLNTGVANSGTGSMMYKEAGSKTVAVPVRPIDDMVAEFKAPRIDFIKMDIEGAEREALKGAAATLKRWRPRMALDSYHLPDDAVVLPQVIFAANPMYETTCGPCELNTNHGKRISPHVTFYR
jgi:FkbM family methyltransferase